MTVREHIVRRRDRDGSARLVRYWCADLGTVDGRRRRRIFSTRSGAEQYVRDARDAQARAGNGPLAVSAGEWADYLAARAEALAAGCSVRAAVHAAVAVPSGPVPTIAGAIDACIAAKRGGNRRERYVRALEDLLVRFARGRETLPIWSVTHKTVTDWLETVPAASRPTWINRLSTLFSHATRAGWIKSNPCDRIERPTVDQTAPAILSVAKCRAALDWTRSHQPALIPWLALGLFAGLRPEEADAVAWADVDLPRGLLRVETSKVRQRRLVDLHATAVEWLTVAKGTGRLPIPRGTRRRAQRELRDALGLRHWPKDVLRHTAASHLLALHRDAARVALWLGNSPRILLRHYRELVTPGDNAKFWALHPDDAGEWAKRLKRLMDWPESSHPEP